MPFAILINGIDSLHLEDEAALKDYLVWLAKREGMPKPVHPHVRLRDGGWARAVEIPRSEYRPEAI